MIIYWLHWVARILAQPRFWAQSHRALIDRRRRNQTLERTRENVCVVAYTNSGKPVNGLAVVGHVAVPRYAAKQLVT